MVGTQHITKMYNVTNFVVNMCCKHIAVAKVVSPSDFYAPLRHHISDTVADVNSLSGRVGENSRFNNNTDYTVNRCWAYCDENRGEQNEAKTWGNRMITN